MSVGLASPILVKHISVIVCTIVYIKNMFLSSSLAKNNLIAYKNPCKEQHKHCKVYSLYSTKLANI